MRGLQGFAAAVRKMTPVEGRHNASTCFTFSPRVITLEDLDALSSEAAASSLLTNCGGGGAALLHHLQI
jgi:hypothetical protein